MKWVPIASIIPDGVAQCACIAVSHPSRLYITRDRILTHNSSSNAKGGNPLDAMKLTSMRMSEALGEMRVMLNEHNATANERTIDGNPIEAAGYVMRRDDDMLMLANKFLDNLAEQQSRSGSSVDESKAALVKMLETGERPDGGNPISADEQAVILRALRLERGGQFGFDPAELDVLYQKKASQAGYALRQGRLILDPLDKVVEEANVKTGVAMTTAFGPAENGQGGAAGLPAALNAELQGELLKENEGALAESLREMREKVRDLRKELRVAQDLAAEEKARADQEREVGIAIGREEGLAQGRAEQPPAPDPQLDRFELWLMGEKHAPGLEGLPSVEQVARRFIRSQSWDAAQFRNAVAQLFPDLNTDILDDAVERIDEMMRNKAEAAQRRAISGFMDRLKERGQKRGKGQWQDSKFATFFGHLQKAAQFGVLNSQTFANAFAHAWGLHGITAANIASMRNMLNALQNPGPDDHGMVREHNETAFIKALNAMLPGQTVHDLLFESSRMGVLSSLASATNQASSLSRILAPLDMFSRADKLGLKYSPDVWFRELARGWASVFKNLPMMVSGFKGDPLGHLPSMLEDGHVPKSQRLQYLAPGESLRVDSKSPLLRKVVGSRAATYVLRAKTQWPSRAIRAMEGVAGIVDHETHFLTTLASHYRSTGMSPRDAYNKAVSDIYSPSDSDKTAARLKAHDEQQQGLIGKRKRDLERRAEEHLNQMIQQRVNGALVDKVDRLTAFTNFKTMPLGFPGWIVAKGLARATSAEHAPGRLARWYFMFGRFFGHNFDLAFGHLPGIHLLTGGNESWHDDPENPRLKEIKKQFGSIEEYNNHVRARAFAGSMFLLSVGTTALLAALKAMGGGDDEKEEPVFAVTGYLPGASRETKQALQASGRWGEGQIRIGGKAVLNYANVPELAPLLTVIGTLMDSFRFRKALNQEKITEDGAMPGKRNQSPPVVAGGALADALLAPVKRSTYKQFFDLFGKSMDGDPSMWGRITQFATKPIDGMLRFPVIVDADKMRKKMAGQKTPEGLADSLLRRIPFVVAGTDSFNAYGERMHGYDVVPLIPSDPKFSEDAKRAALLNVETGTIRSLPQDPKLRYGDGSILEFSAEKRAEYHRLSGQLYTESLLRHEEAIRRAYGQGGQGAAAKIVGNISTKANREARSRLGLE